MPSFTFSSSFTACGLALPPDNFITWPTNQPIIAGFILRLLCLLGIALQDGDDELSISEMSLTCFIPRASTVTLGSPPSTQVISNRVLCDFARNGAGGDQIEDAPSCAADIGELAISLPALFNRPARSLMTQFAAALASRPLADCLEEFSGLAFGREHTGVVGGEPVARDEARLLFVGELRQTCPELLDVGRIKLQRQQVGIGK